jgi:hypothetical protein
MPEHAGGASESHPLGGDCPGNGIGEGKPGYDWKSCVFDGRRKSKGVAGSRVLGGRNVPVWCHHRAGES